ncbi:MAG: phosphohistidine phosphatase SixA [bacterium]
MKLYLVQHGEATSGDIDPRRPLTEKGEQDVIKTARFLKKSGAGLDFIWHSTKTRAVETAQIIAKELSLPGDVIKQREGLAPNDPVKKVFDDILSAGSDLMIVSHLPFLQKLVSLALLNSESSSIVGFRQGGVVCLEYKVTGAWELIFAIPPDLLQ